MSFCLGDCSGFVQPFSSMEVDKRGGGGGGGLVGLDVVYSTVLLLGE